MDALLSLLESTPKLKNGVSRSKLLSVSVVSEVTKSPGRAKTVPAPRQRPRKSKSLNNLNNIISGERKKRNALRNSSSLNDLNTHKMKYPITPMCLKRKIFKAKEKISKTTEELELEHIAKLRNQLRQQMRQNEISLKKLNLGPRQCAASKILPKYNLKDIKDAGAFAEKTNVAEKEPRRNIRMPSQTALKTLSSEVDAIINRATISNNKTGNVACPRTSQVDSVSAVRKEVSKLNIAVNNEASSSRSTTCSRKPKTLCVSTTVSDKVSNATQKAKRLPHKKIVAHSGLIFIPSLKRNSFAKSLFSEEKNKEKPQAAAAKQKETSTLNLEENSDKVNKGCSRPELSSK